MGRQGKKRLREELGGEEVEHSGSGGGGGGGGGGSVLRAPEELPQREAAAVAAALERWHVLRCRVNEIRPALEQEDRLMQDILSHGLQGEDRKTLRKLASSSREETEAEAAQLAAALGPERSRLQDVLMRNQRALLELSTSAKTASKQEVLEEMERALDVLRAAQETVHVDLLGAKEREDMLAVRSTGRALNDLKALTRRLGGERRGLTRNSALAALLVTVCRRVLPVRHVDPVDLGEVSPSYDGYLQILDFYFFSDASLYCFGEHFSGPNWFTRLKRNVAILTVRDSEDKLLFNTFAVSGEHKTPGAPLAPAIGGPLQSIEAEDEHGRVFDRLHDAEFKLLTGFCLATAGKTASVSGGRATLWSKKPLCRSCAGAVRQVQARFPSLELQVEVGDPNAAACDGGHAGSASMLGDKVFAACAPCGVARAPPFAAASGCSGNKVFAARAPGGVAREPEVAAGGVAREPEVAAAAAASAASSSAMPPAVPTAPTTVH